MLSNSELSSAINLWQGSVVRYFTFDCLRIGWELEFYFQHEPSPSCIDEIKVIDGVACVKKEIGYLQHEVTSHAFSNCVEACEFLESLRSKMQEIAKKHANAIVFNGFVREDLPLSSLQLSFAFYKNGVAIEIDDAMLQIVNNVLERADEMVEWCLPTENCLQRIDGEVMARRFRNSVTHATWGTENRTVLVRLAKMAQGRRLEFRLASPLANAFHVMTLLLGAMLVHSSKKFLQTFVDSFELQSQRLPFERSIVSEAFYNGQIWLNIKKLLLKNVL